MKAYRIDMFVYADSQEEATKLEKDLFNFVNEKREQGIAVRATKVSIALEKFKNNIFVNNFLKQ